MTPQVDMFLMQIIYGDASPCLNQNALHKSVSREEKNVYRV